MVEVIQKIKTAEETADDLRKTCRQIVAQIKEDAATKGKLELEQRAKQAAAESASILQKAEAEAAAYLDGSHEKSRALCEEQIAAARGNMGKAVDFIVERIVGSQ